MPLPRAVRGTSVPARPRLPGWLVPDLRSFPHHSEPAAPPGRPAPLRPSSARPTAPTSPHSLRRTCNPHSQGIAQRFSPTHVLTTGAASGSFLPLPTPVCRPAGQKMLFQSKGAAGSYELGCMGSATGVPAKVPSRRGRGLQRQADTHRRVESDEVAAEVKTQRTRGSIVEPLSGSRWSRSCESSGKVYLFVNFN